MLSYQSLMVKMNLKISKGDRKGQLKRRRKRLKGQKPTKYYYQCIDGNWTKYPVAYCLYHKGELTKGLMDTHRCKQRKCPRLCEGEIYE